MKPFSLEWWLEMYKHALLKTDELGSGNPDYTTEEFIECWQRYTINLAGWIEQRIIDKYDY